MAALQVAATLACSTLAPSLSASSFRRRSSSSASVSLLSSPSRLSASLSPKPFLSLPLRRRPLTVTNVAQKPSDLKDRPATEALEELVIPSVPSADASPPDATSPGFTASPRKIWMSDVVATPKRPYFLNRKYTSKDIQYIVYMAVVHGLCLFAPATFSWDAFGVFLGLYVITGMFGITLSYHRHLSHKSFVLPKWLEYTFAYCGVQAIQGPPMEWVSAHRFHHRHCDTPEDPHTPYEGFWHSHMGWLLDDQATQERVGNRNNIADMQNDAFYNFIEETYPWHVVASAALLYAIGGFPYLVWGFAVRAVWVYHITWFVNSASHVWGYQSWNTGDLSRNNWWVGILAFGEGWHNNHHAFEYSCRHGLEWWQYDPTWYTVKLLEAVGLATKLRYPTEDHMARLSFPEKKAT